MKELFVLDAAGYIYRSYHAIGSMTNGDGQSTNALFGFVRSVQKLIKDFHPEHLVAVFDGPDNIKARKEAYPEYKANRAETPGDLIYQMDWAQEFCGLFGIPSLSVPEVEADDTMGSIAKWAEKDDVKVYLCTSDKDMAQLVNDHVVILNTFKDNLILDSEKVGEVYGVPPSQIIDWLSMTGDASDNVPGIPGFGPKTASSLLKEFSSLDTLLEHPEKAKGKKQEALREFKEQALLSRELVTINTNVHFPKEADFFALKTPQHEQLREFYHTMGFNTLLRDLETLQGAPKAQQETVRYHLVNNETELRQLLETLSKQPLVCFDTETTHENPLRAHLVGIGLGYQPKEAWYIPLNGAIPEKTVLELVKPFFENPEIGFIGHNAKYDCHVLKNVFISVATIAFDTMLASYVLNSHDRRHSLDHLSLRLFDKVKTPITELIGKGRGQITMAEVSIPTVSDYCCEDVDYTLRLHKHFTQELSERGLEDLFYNLELPLSRILEEMEWYGIAADTAELQALSAEFQEKGQAIAASIYELAGEEFNIHSPKQLSEILKNLGVKWPRGTKEGSTAADILERLQEEYPICEKILEYRSLEKLRSTYCDTLPNQVLEKDHRIHCTFNQSVAATGRLSCQDPNLQNIPKRTPEGLRIRAAFKPEKRGWVYLSADYSQIELRLLAHLSEDPTLIKAFKEGEDIHRSTAAAIFEVPLEEVTSEQRHQAKAVNFGILYGQSASGLARTLNIPYPSAQQFIKTYFHRFAKVEAFIASCIDKARQTGKAVTLTGRERLIPEIESKNHILRNAAERLAVNSPLQGTAADLIKYAMLRVHKALKASNLQGFMILQIHDELIFEAPESEGEPLGKLVHQCMEGVWALKVPLVVDVSVGKNWKEC